MFTERFIELQMMSRMPPVETYVVSTLILVSFCVIIGHETSPKF